MGGVGWCVGWQQFWRGWQHACETRHAGPGRGFTSARTCAWQPSPHLSCTQHPLNPVFICSCSMTAPRRQATCSVRWRRLWCRLSGAQRRTAT